MGNELPVFPQGSAYIMPIAELQLAVVRRQAVEAFARNVMIEGTDYGKIPGTDKNTLLKPGAEKLCSFFGLVPEFVVTHEVLDFDGSGAGNGEALLYYRVRCDLYRDGIKVGSGDASCGSREKKYRWTNEKAACPNCGKELRLSKEGGGWYCWAKQGGCGKTYTFAQVPRPTGKVPNPDIADLDNTILKMAEKRALIAATLIATNVSEFFTQDMEDFVDAAPIVEASAPPAPAKATSASTNGKAAAGSKKATEATLEKISMLGLELRGDEWDESDAASWVSEERTKAFRELTQEEADKLLERLKKNKAKLAREAADAAAVEAPKQAPVAPSIHVDQVEEMPF